MSPGTTDLTGIVARRFAESAEVSSDFFRRHADGLSQVCLEMARRFRAGGRLLVFGEGAQASDANHVSVEFVHPVIVGKRALPAIALGRGAGSGSWEQLISVLGRPPDIALGISVGAGGTDVAQGLRRARAHGMLTIALGGDVSGAEYGFAVPSNDAMVVQEVHETTYHILWELVHVFFEHQVIE